MAAARIRRFVACGAVMSALLVISFPVDYAGGAEAERPNLPPLPVLPPTALTGDPGDGRAYLRWNIQIEDERVIGWKVLQLAPRQRTITPDVLTEAHFVVTGLDNGTEYTFAVAGVLKDGSTTPHSNTAAVTPRDVGTARVERAPRKITVGEFKDIELGRYAARVVFPDGQELVWDRLRPIDWKTRDGQHLIYPLHFGNGLDIGQFDERGLPMVIPPEGLSSDRMPGVDNRWMMISPGSTDMFSARWEGFIRPRYSEQYTIHVISDDGVRVWIDNDLLIDQWKDQPPTEHSAKVQLEAGRKYPIRVEYYERTGGATLQLAWSSPSQAREVVPASQLYPPNSSEQAGTGLRGTYFGNLLLKDPILTRIDPVVDFSWGSGGPVESRPPKFYYRDVQYGTLHPYITDPLTLPLSGRLSNDNRMRWFPPQVNGNRVTFHYWQPLEILGYRSWNYVLVWETWWPIERDRHGCLYHGFARQIEVQLPSFLKHGYQVMINNGFGPGGSRKGVISYSTGFREPGHEVIDFSGDENRQVVFQSPKPPRQGYGYHPDHDCLQASPLIFYDWGTGSMTITARSLYYHCANASSSYIEQGADGVWPNLAWDLAASGRRVYVDTVEYLYTADVQQPLPQRFINARFETYGNVSRRMGVQDTLGAIAMDAPHSQIKRGGGPVPFANNYIRRVEGQGLDVIAMYHDIWHAVPIVVDDAYRLNDQHDCNPALKAMCDAFRAAGYTPGFWFRPEFVKTSVPTALSDTIPTAEVYYGYDMAKYPDAVSLLHERGMPIFRRNTGWVRRTRDGGWPYRTPYQWTPMSLATGWWDRIMWPTLRMTARLGFGSVLVDGGFGGMQGVDYAPMLNGDAPAAVPCQPYWWRMWRTMYHVGIKMFGECTVGWKGGSVVAGGEGDEYYQWMFSMGWYIGVRGALQSPELTHRTYQLYNSNRGDAKAAAVRRFAQKFYKQHRAPDWIELKDLRQVDPVEFVAEVGESPVAGIGTRTTNESTREIKVRPWIWGDAVWHYDDGTSVVYPAYDKIDWSKQ